MKIKKQKELRQVVLETGRTLEKEFIAVVFAFALI